MATVYLADDLKHERKVALKVLKPELAAVVGAERFLAEIKTTANLQHPHILPLVGAFPGGDPKSQISYSGGHSPRWSPSGSEIVYRDGYGGWAMRSVGVVPSPGAFVRGQESTLFEWARFDNDRWNVSNPEGGFIMVRPLMPEDASYSFVVVENFFEELKRLVPN